MRKLIHKLSKESLLYQSPIHGLKHWITVERNGLYLATFNDADPYMISLFAYLHDCKRENEYADLKHGHRAAEYAHQIREEFIDLNNEKFDKLYHALKYHSQRLDTDDVTISTCWDADRLDLDRVGIYPDPDRLFNAEAKRIAEEVDLTVLDEQPKKKWLSSAD
jgi:uncharacterized protein